MPEAWHLHWTFVGGMVVAGVALLVSTIMCFALSYLRPRMRSVAPLAVLGSAIAFNLYVLLYMNWVPGFETRTADFVRQPWMRGASTAGLLMLNALIVGASVGLSEGDFMLAVGAGVFGGVSLLLADFCPYPQSWLFWAFGVSALWIFQTYFIYYTKAYSKQARAKLIFLISLPFPVALPIIQALSWTMAKKLDVPPHRINSEIAFVVVYGVELLFLLAASVLYRLKKQGGSVVSLQQ